MSRFVTSKDRNVFQGVSNAALARRIKATILKNVIIGHSANYLIQKTNDVSLFALLGVVNSKAVNFYFKFYNQTNHVPIGDFKQIPFPKLNPEAEVQLASIVKNIIAIKKDNIEANVSDFECQIDLRVFHLYNLSYDEVLIIDPKTPITEEEYDNFIFR